MSRTTVQVHGAGKTKPQSELIGPEPVTIFVRIAGVTFFFDSVAQGVTLLTDAITALKHAEHRYLSPPDDEPDSHLEADYDDRNGD